MLAAAYTRLRGGVAGGGVCALGEFFGRVTPGLQQARVAAGEVGWRVMT